MRAAGEEKVAEDQPWSVRLNSQHLTQLKALAKAEHRTVSGQIRFMIERDIKEYERELEDAA